ncbi:hypothetical protein ACCO45_003901 [Purpureocillium lilacinum]|uniref:Uncharacterized protein n=1 Tax=Purpureocillium lilacinum TaxID=33203 RepID=A0ACC4E4C8_PURLI
MCNYIYKELSCQHHYHLVESWCSKYIETERRCPPTVVSKQYCRLPRTTATEQPPVGEADTAAATQDDAVPVPHLGSVSCPTPLGASWRPRAAGECGDCGQLALGRSAARSSAASTARLTTRPAGRSCATKQRRIAPWASASSGRQLCSVALLAPPPPARLLLLCGGCELVRHGRRQMRGRHDCRAAPTGHRAQRTTHRRRAHEAPGT